MYARTAAAIAALASVWMGAATLTAHHGTNISYDRSKTFTAKAVVTEFKYVNPHVQLFFDVTDDKGKVRHWSGELLPKDFIQSSGWASLLEDLCAPANENEFNRVIRDPSGTGKPAVPVRPAAPAPARRRP